MKSQPFPIPSPTPAQRLSELIRLQHEALLRVLQRDTKGAPCRNRTCNLMIKSHIRAYLSARTGAAQLAPHASNVAELVPHTYPKIARRFHDPIPELPRYHRPDPYAPKKTGSVTTPWLPGPHRCPSCGFYGGEHAYNCPRK